MFQGRFVEIFQERSVSQFQKRFVKMFQKKFVRTSAKTSTGAKSAMMFNLLTFIRQHVTSIKIIFKIKGYGGLFCFDPFSAAKAARERQMSVCLSVSTSFKAKNSTK